MTSEEKKSFNSWFYILVIGFILFVIGILFNIWILRVFSIPVSNIICGIYHFFNDIYSRGWLSRTWRIVYGCGYIGFGFFIIIRYFI